MKRWISVLVVLICLGWVISSFSRDEWKEKRCRHFYIFYKDAPVDFVTNVEESAERSYEEIIYNLGFGRHHRWASEERAKIYVYNDQKDYVISAKQAEWSHGAAYFHRKIIRTFPAAHGFFDSTLPHELGHIVFRDFVGPCPTIPLWFDEGVAMFQEKAKRWGAHKVVKRAIEDKSFIPLRELSKIRLRGDISQATIDLFYAESASVVYFMIKELDQHRFLDFCRKLRMGQNFYQAMKNSYSRFKEIQDLEDAWVNYLQRNY